jgi:hypothetical protein
LIVWSLSPGCFSTRDSSSRGLRGVPDAHLKTSRRGT